MGEKSKKTKSIAWRMKISMKAAAQELGVAEETLRRWEQAGKIRSERTAGGHRRSDLASLTQYAKKAQELERTQEAARMTVGYARVPSQDQRSRSCCDRSVSWRSTAPPAGGRPRSCKIVDRDSGCRKCGLRTLMERICSGEIERLVLTHQDRLLRFGAEFVFALGAHFGTEVVIINAAQERSFEEDLVQDV